MTNRPCRLPVRRRVLSALAVAVCCALTACAPAATRSDDANILASVSDHLDESSSAVATARLAVRARADGRLPAVTADVAVGDAAETATGAVHGIGTVVVSGADAERVRDDALAAASGAVRPVAAARTWLGGPASSADDVLRALDDAAGALDDANGAVQHAQRTAP
ncbi:hypothetical protein GCM10027063_46290 [Promicromonospora xylanilytica]